MQLRGKRHFNGAASESSSSTLLVAALALPGLAASMGHAQSPPEQASVEAIYLDYQDWQPGASRMSVRSPAFYLVTPLGENYAFAGNYVADSISGASPLFHSTLSGASLTGIREYRRAGEAALTRYFPRASVAVHAGVSTENDYFSRSAGVDGTFSTEDQNTTLAVSLGGSDDRINSVNFVAAGKTRHTLDYLVGITQVLSPQSLLQLNLTYTRGHGYYSDPYKPLDRRPDEHDQTAVLVRYNYGFDSVDGVLRLSFRVYRDDWGLCAHTAEAAWNQALPRGWSITPGLRYYVQNAADFYHGPPFPQGFVFGGLYSADERLSAFGAWAPSLSFAKEIDQGWSVNVKAEFYRQRADWRLGGGGSPGLQTFSARSLIVGVKKTF